MILTISRNDNTLELAGKLNAETAPQFDAAIKPMIDHEKSLVIDMKDLEYISSPGPG